MIFSFFLAAIVGVLMWLLAMLPTTGCEAINLSSIDLGVGGAYLNLPVMVAAFSLMVAFEAAVVGYRIALWLINLVKP